MLTPDIVSISNCVGNALGYVDYLERLMIVDA